MKGFFKALEAVAKEIDKLPDQLAPFVVQAVRDNMKNGKFKANAPLTKNLKNGGAKPLFDSGETYASITYKNSNGLIRVGTNKAHAPLINYGGVVKPKKAKSLMIPTTKQVKKVTDAKGIKKTLQSLENKDWHILWRASSVIGIAPPGAKGFGLKLKANKDKDQDGDAYLLFYRARKIKVPKREFMKLTDEQQLELMEMAQEQLAKVFK